MLSQQQSSHEASESAWQPNPVHVAQNEQLVDFIFGSNLDHKQQHRLAQCLLRECPPAFSSVNSKKHALVFLGFSLLSVMDKSPCCLDACLRSSSGCGHAHRNHIFCVVQALGCLE